MSDDSFLKEFIEHVAQTQSAIDLIVLGGSTGEGSADTHSDFDLFAFCSDDVVKSNVDSLCTWVDRRLGAGALRHGPYLRDEFGIGYRFFLNGDIRVELFFISPALWIPSPAQGKGQVVYARSTTRAIEWERRLSQCREATFVAHDYPTRFVREQALVWVQKVDKYFRRGQQCMAVWYCLKLHQAVIALELVGASRVVFEPDYGFKILNRTTHPDQVEAELELMGQLVKDPEHQFACLLHRARSALKSLNLQTEFDDCLERLDRRPHGSCSLD